MLRSVFYCIVFFTASFPHLLFPQSEPLRFRRISVADGLSQQTVNAIAQDKQGFVWFGTQGGLNRFDGYLFTIFNSSAENSAGLQNNFISRLLCTNDGKIWAGTIDGGVSVYDTQKELFTTYRNIPGNSSSLRTNNASALYQDRNGMMWVGTWNGGLSEMDTTGGKVRFIHYLHNPKDAASLSDNRVSSMIEDREGNFWVGTWNGLNRMKSDGGFTKYFHSNSDPYSLGGNMVWTLTLDSTGCIWIGTWDGGVSCYDPKTNRFRVYKNIPLQPGSLSSNRIRCVYTDYNGIVWVGTYDTGLDQYNPLSDGFIHHRNIPTDPSSLPDDEIQSVMQDAAGTFWVGTASGIANFNPYRHKFPLLKFPDDIPTASFNQPRALHVDHNSEIWYGTRGGGLVHVLQSSGKFIRYLHSPKDPFSLSHDFVSVLYEGKDGALWVGMQGGGLNKMERKTGRFQHFAHDPNDSTTLSTNSIASVLETSDGSLWIGIDGGGLDRMNPKTEKFSHFRNIAGDSTSLSGNYVWALLEDQKDNLWIGTWGASLCRFDSKSQKFIRFRHVPGDSATLPATTVHCMAEDLQGRIWIGTTNGLSCFDYSISQFKNYNERHGLANRIINGIIVDRHNAIWVATNRGISRLDEATQSFKNYTMSDGLQGIEFAQGVCAVDSQGRIYFGGSGGINYFDPDSVRDNPFIPSVRITRMKVMEQPFSFANVSDEGIVLNYDQNFLSFEYAALSFAIPEKNLYSYMLEGLDTGWVEAGTRRYTSYTGLSPGTYIFRVRGSNNDAVWNLEGASLRIIITPPFWRRWWFVTLAIAALVLSVISVVRARERRLIAIERMRTRIARDLHDEIGSNLTGIAMSSKLMMQQKNFTEIEQEQLTEIGTTAQRTSELMRDIVWLINPGNDSLEELLTRMKSTAYTLLGPIEHTFNSVIEIKEKKIALELKQNIFLIYKEALTNIAKHSSAVKVDISVNVNGELLTLRIADNGSGFSAPQSTMGNGLQNMKNRANSIGANFIMESEAGKGTVVSLSVKII